MLAALVCAGLISYGLDLAHPVLFALASLISLPILKTYWGWFFGDVGGSLNDLSQAALPDILAACTGRYWAGQWAEAKIIVFGALAAGFVAAMYKLLTVLYNGILNLA